MNREYAIKHRVYRLARFVGTFKVILSADDSRNLLPPLMVAKVEDIWWICTTRWEANLDSEPLSDDIGHQLDNYHQHYINELIVGAPEASEGSIYGL